MTVLKYLDSNTVEEISFPRYVFRPVGHSPLYSLFVYL